MRSNREEFRSKCRICPLINLCMWCPAHTYLETGELGRPVVYFCGVAHTRAEALKKTDEQSNYQSIIDKKGVNEK